MHEYDQEDDIEVTPDIKEENTYENSEMPSEFNEEIFSDDFEVVSYENESVNPETNSQSTAIPDPVFEGIKPVSRQIFQNLPFPEIQNQYSTIITFLMKFLVAIFTAELFMGI